MAAALFSKRRGLAGVRDMRWQFLCCHNFEFETMSWERVEAILNGLNSHVRRISLLASDNAQDVFELRAKLEAYEDDLEDLKMMFHILARSNERLSRIIVANFKTRSGDELKKEVAIQSDAIANIGRIVGANEEASSDDGGGDDASLEGLKIVSE